MGNILANTRSTRGQVIPLFTTPVEMDCYTNNFLGLPCFKKLTADKHVLVESHCQSLPLVPFVIVNLTCLTVDVCMRFKSKLTSGFSFSRFATRVRRFTALSSGEKSRKPPGTRVTIIQLTMSFLIGRKPTVNFQNQHI